MLSRTKTARIAGLLYLPVVLTGPFVLLYVPGRVFVPGDASATVANLLANEMLFRAGIVVGVIGEFLFISAVLMLHRLLKDVGRDLAALMLIPILIHAPLAFLGSANAVATLEFARGADFLSVFDKPQRDAVVMLLLQFDRKGVLISEIFWGLWLLPLGVLVHRSRFLPRFLGVWLFVNGLAYLAISLTGLLAPPNHRWLSTMLTPVLFGEVALMLWLIVRGARVRAGASAEGVQVRTGSPARGTHPCAGP